MSYIFIREQDIVTSVRYYIEIQNSPVGIYTLLIGKSLVEGPCVTLRLSKEKYKELLDSMQKFYEEEN